MYIVLWYTVSQDEELLIKIRDLMEEFTARMELKREMVQFDFDPMGSY